MRSAHLFFLLTHELVLFYGFIVIFALFVKPLAWLHNFIEHNPCTDSENGIFSTTQLSIGKIRRGQ